MIDGTVVVRRLQEREASGAWCGPDDSWVAVRAGDTEPFSFGARARSRARPHASAAAPAPLHRLALRLDAWTPPHPVCVDRVGVFFRRVSHTVRLAPPSPSPSPSARGRNVRFCSQKTGAEARLVFEVSLEGSARKLVTVRSALQIVNRLPNPVEVRVDHALPAGEWRRTARLAGAGRRARLAGSLCAERAAAGAAGGGAAPAPASRAAGRSLQRALAQRLPLLPAPRSSAAPALQALHPLLADCGYLHSPLLP